MNYEGSFCPKNKIFESLQDLTDFVADDSGGQTWKPKLKKPKACQETKFNLAIHKQQPNQWKQPVAQYLLIRFAPTGPRHMQQINPRLQTYKHA